MREMAMDSDLSTHWTTLNLKKNGGTIEVRYADSTGSRDGKDNISQAIKGALSKHGIAPETQQVDFTSGQQTAANCG